MSALLENIVISLLTGVMASAGVLQVAPSLDAPRDWVAIGATGTVAFAGAFINGMRQLHKTP
jgi:hypothetical protein